MKKIYSLIGSLVLLTACDTETKIEQEDVLRPVRSVIVGNDNGFHGRQFSAVIDAAKTARLSFSISGKIEKLDVTESQDVKKGEEIAKLDQADIKIALTSAQADYDQAKADFDRGRQLVAEGHISRSDFDKLKAKYIGSQSKLDSVERDLENTRLVAPFDGVVANRFVESFEEINAKESIIEIQDLSSLLVKIQVSEQVMVKARQDNIKPDFLMELDSLPGKFYPVTFKEAITRADETTQTYEVTFVMPGVTEGNVLPGMTGLLHVKHLENKQRYVTLPANVVLSDQQGQYVYTVESLEPGVGVVKKTPVVAGELLPTGLKIESGLDVGDEVVTAGMTQLADNMQVKMPVDEK